jgi:hypothetical protein
MKPRPILVALTIAALMLACNMPGASGQPNPAPTSPAGPPAVATATVSAAAPATDTPNALPTDTATPAVTDTPSTPMVTPIKDPVNCRFGPSGAYESVGAGLAVGVNAPVLGKNLDSSWFQIAASNGTENCWVSAAVVRSTGDFASVPLVDAPTAFVTALTLSVKPVSINLGPGCPGPAPLFNIKGSISVNGPVLVKWHFETEQGGSMSGHSTNFSAFGATPVTASYSPAVLKKGTFWIRLIVTSPNSIMMETSYQIKCQ